MANELQYSMALSFSKGNAQTSRASGTLNITVSGDDYIQGTQSIGTVDEVISLVDIGTPGLVLLHNCDATNYVDYGADGTNYSVRIKAGEWAIFRASGAAIHLKANTAACIVEFIVVEA